MKTSDWLQLAGLSIVFGATFLFFALGLKSITPLTIVLIRVSLAAAVFWVLILVFRLPLPRGRRVWGAFLVMGLLNNAIPFSLIAWEQTQIESGLASIINATASCFTVVLAHCLTRDERLSVRKVVGVLVGFFGVYVLLRPELVGGITMRGWGQVAGLCAAFFLALAGIYGKRFNGLSPMVIAAGMLTSSTILILPLALVVERPWTLAPTAVGLGAMVGVALLSTVVAYLLYFRILASAGATNLLLVTLLVPVSAHVLGAAFLGEPLYATSAAGMAFIVCGLAITDGRIVARLRGAGGGEPDASIERAKEMEHEEP
jgi:drug/metabolite transporter (DMT)-like permease